MKTDIVYAVEKVEIGVSTGSLTPPSTIVVANNIEDGSVSYTSNKDTATSITPEDKDVPLVTLFTPSDGDSFNFALLEFSQDNLGLVFNVETDPTTNTTTFLATKKHANLWIRLTTRPQFGIKKVFVFPNTTCDVAYKNNFTKNALVSLAITATLNSFTAPSGSDAIYTMQAVNADGSAITPPSFDTTLDFTSNASVTTGGITGTIGAANATVKFKFNAISNQTGTPLTMSLKIAGSEVMSVDYPTDFVNQPFSYVDSGGIAHGGVFPSGGGDVNLS